MNSADIGCNEGVNSRLETQAGTREHNGTPSLIHFLPLLHT